MPLKSNVWQRHTVSYNQGNIGSCTGNAAAGMLMTDPYFTPSRQLSETDAVRLYSEATQIDTPGAGYPPNDNGSTGLSVMKAARKEGLIRAYYHVFDIDILIKYLGWVGPAIFGTNWYDCLPNDQRVLTSDLRWVPIQKVSVGDELLGFDECLGRKARVRRAQVLNMGIKHLPVYEITTDRGKVVASKGHKFVFCDPKLGQFWINASDIQPGDRLAYFLDPYEEDNSWEAGWLAGFLDGEGTIGGDYQVNFGQAVGPVLDRAINYLSAMGFEAYPKQVRLPTTDGRGIVSRKEFNNVYVTGPYHGSLRLLGQVRPIRLLEKGARLWEGASTCSRRCPPVVVQDVRCIGVEEVNTIATSTKTLFVEGLLSHNSFDQPDSNTGLVTISPNAQVRGGHEIELIGVDVEAQTIRFCNSWGPGWGDHGCGQWKWEDFRRLQSEQGDITVAIR